MDSGALKKNLWFSLPLILLVSVLFYNCRRTGSQDLEGNKYLYSNSNLRVELEEPWIRIGENTQGHLYFYSIPEDPVNQPILQVYKEPVFRSEYLDFNNTGDLLVSSHEDGNLRLWKITIHGGS